ncbi:hypothetical protein PT974_10358 [Cladobotryum mycophilum]|uniref:Uncharacterized protein n=1 Tax=Cladobotryum mycophilum TaxID=491253 RepID=A0ABR0SAI3_9HYPO
MPSFGRLGKHSNRSHHTVTEPPSLPSGVSAAAAAGAGNTNTLGPGPGVAGIGGSAGGAGTGGGGVGTALEADSPPDATPQSALSSSALSSSESFVDARQTQQQQQQQAAAVAAAEAQHHHQQQQQHQQSVAPPPAHLYHQGSSTGVNPSASIGSFDGHEQQLQQQPPPNDFDAAAHSRTSAQQYGLPFQLPPPPPPLPSQQQLQLQQQLYGSVSTTSLDNISSVASYLQTTQGAPAPPPQAAAPAEKRSTRKLLKGIFAKATGNQDHSSHHHHRQSESSAAAAAATAATAAAYDNTVGLGRRSSKRVSTSKTPNLKTNLSPASQLSSDRDWQTPSSGHHQQQQPSPLHDAGEVDDYNYREHQSDRTFPSQDSRIIPPLNTIRQVSNEVEISSPYDEDAYQPPPHPPPNHQQQAPPSQLQHPPGHVQVLTSHEQQQQQPRYDPQQVAYDQNHSPQQPSAQHYDSYQQTGDPRLVTSHLGPIPQQSHQQNPETISQLSHDSPAPDVDQRSMNQQLEHASPVVHYSTVQTQDLPPSAQTIPPPAMASGSAPPTRTAGPPPGFWSNSNMPPTSPLPGGPVLPGQTAPPANAQYRGDRPPQYDGAGVEKDRNSPQPSTTQERDADSEKAFKELLTKYKNVKRLYFDGKSQIEQLTSQVEHLQNAFANQRMSQSRTALDDSEYATRFNRLNGAINNLSFNIRKDWRCLPQWLEKYVSPDALKTGKQEMTAVGRAVISRWVVEEIFNKCFHPGLEQTLSAQLKEVELSIRGNAYTMHSQEEFDALTTKVVNWRMATLEGLQQKLGGTTTTDNRHVLTTKLTTNLTACLYQYLNTPPPSGVEGSTSMIVELAIGIAANLPLESRDVSIAYPLPGEILQPHLMEVEKGDCLLWMAGNLRETQRRMIRKARIRALKIRENQASLAPSQQKLVEYDLQDS